MKFLGHMVSADGVDPLPEKLETTGTGLCPIACVMLGHFRLSVVLQEIRKGLCHNCGTVDRFDPQKLTV